MRRVDRAFEDLRPVAGDQHLRDGNAERLVGRPGRRREGRHRVRRPHVGPDEAGPFMRRIGEVLDLVDQATRHGLGHHLEHVAVDVHLPAVIEAAQSAIFVAPHHERRPTMRAVLVHHPDAPVGVAKDDEILAEHTGADRRAVRVWHLLDKADRGPVAAHQPAHRRIALDSAEQVVFFGGEHVRPRPVLTRVNEVAKKYLGA